MEWISRPIFIQSFPNKHHHIVDARDVDASIGTIRKLATPTTEAIFYGFNPMKDGVKGVPGTDDIARRRLLFLDADHPEHVKKIPASKEGKAAAFSTFDRASTWLLYSCRWPAPAVIDSGNGPHGYWHIDLPNDEASDTLVGDFLEALYLKFGPLIDTANKDARRLGRVPGTWNRRGPATADRPHRLCRIIDLPELVGPVSENMIYFVINEINAEQKEKDAAAERSWNL